MKQSFYIMVVRQKGVFHVKHFDAILFDYNGTLFFDADINEWAWHQTIDEISGGTINFPELYKEYKGTKNQAFVEKIFDILNMPREEDKIVYWCNRKETEYYQKYCLAQGRNKMAPGAEELLDYLKERQIPINMSTASLETNVDFYFRLLNLERWFDRNKVAYDEGFKDKTDMYKASAQRIGTEVNKCLIFEDSPNSIIQAIEAGCEYLVAIKKEDTPDLPQIKQVINDFTELNYEIFE